MNGTCAHWKLDENGETRCALPVCACKLETTDISHIELKDPHADIGYNPYDKPLKVRKQLNRRRAK